MIYSIYKQQFFKLRLYRKSLLISQVMVLMMILTSIAGVIGNTLNFLTVYVLTFDRYTLGLFYFPISILIISTNLNYRTVDYFLIGTRKVLYYQVIAQVVFVQLMIWTPWLVLTMLIYGFGGMIVSPAALVVVLLSAIEVYFNQVLLSIVCMIGYFVTQNRIAGMVAAVSINLTFFLLFMNKMIVPFWRFAIPSAPIDKFLNCLVLISTLYLVMGILGVIIKNKDY
ncbi:hypothetical protein [Lactiplantibacillus paraplantarum]|uniref:hypothetical protein n=1 Tax=Lactiplantibacillus paraplantarum TaxID=60520 RepID=UPI002073543E|nr:hypothetical protein [Lactiplantibacillus paraplantarum]